MPLDMEQTNEGSEESLSSSQVSEGNEQEQSASPAPEQTQTKQPENVPFHEHPRFKEIVEQKNQFARQVEQTSRQLQEMQSRLAQMEQARTAAQKQEDALHARLKGIDPEFGERFAKVDSSLQELEQLKQWKADFEAQQLRERAVNMVDKLHTENNVPKEWQELYNTQIQAFASANPRLGLKDLPVVYKAIHDKMSKMFDQMKRQERESYVTDKKKDASTPSNPKGKAPTQKAGGEYSKNPDEARQQLVANIRKAMRAEKEI
jgi:hypothetical protein